MQQIKGFASDIAKEAEGEALEILTAHVYFDDTPDIVAIEQLKALNLLDLLQSEIGEENYDIGRIKVICRALKVAKQFDSVEYILATFSELVVFAKEITQLMQALDEEFPGCFDELSDDVISAILEPPASSVQLIRTWMLELFARGIVAITPVQLKRIKDLPSILDKRQLHIIQSRIDNQDFFRFNKGIVAQMSPFEQRVFIAGAVCLPKDEFKSWIAMSSPVQN